MKKFFTLLLTFVCLQSTAQNKSVKQMLGELYRNDVYYKIKNEYANDNNAYDAEALFDIAKAYFDLEDYAKSEEFIGLSLSKNPDAVTSLVLYANVLVQRDEYKDALKVLRKAEGIAKETGSPHYESILLFKGSLQYELKQYKNALVTYEALLQISPDDYHVIAKMIQVYYAQKEYDKALPLKQKLYDAHEQNTLPLDMDDMFCFDVFNWEEKRVVAFERYQQGPPDELYYKHLFYVFNEGEKYLYQIQTEFSPTAYKAKMEESLIMGKIKNDIHYTYSIWFVADMQYKELKKAVTDIIDENVKPVSPGKKLR